MLQRHFLTTFALIVLALPAGRAWSEDAVALKTDKEKLSYAIGASIGKNLAKDTTEVDLDVLVAALKQSIAGGKLQLPDKEIRLLMNDYEKALRKQANLRRQKAQVENRERGEAFLAAFRQQPGVQVSPGGVLYRVDKAGEGARPIETDTVVVNYRGSLINGTEFDATETGHPAELTVTALISGWKQALTMMNVGGKWHLVIPSHLAYGERGVGSDIGPNEVLVFDVELVGIK
jgi:FKBP-type peptidyl-prolyl cis-trans isomerase FklB